MLFRKVEKYIREHLASQYDKVLVVVGARQIGKSFIIRKVGTELFKNFIELNFVADKESDRLFSNVKSVDDFYLRLSAVAGDRLGDRFDTLIFLDEIQEYPHLLTLLKFLREDGRYNYIASGSLLGLALNRTTSIPIGSIELLKMYPLDFEEFLIANSVGQTVIEHIRKKFENREELEEPLHNKMLDLFRKYLLAGGLPEAVNSYIDTHNIMRVRTVQRDIHSLYKVDASKYDTEHRLSIARIYEMIPSVLENKKKRVVFRDIEDKKGKRFDDYREEFDYLVDSGIALEVKAVSGPSYPLIESGRKNLMKLYLNDVGLLTNILYGTNIRAVLDNHESVNLGSVYESVVAQEIEAHGFIPYYYDNKSRGEVDYLIDNSNNLSVTPLEVKSGKDYTVHSALSTFVSNEDYAVKEAFVLSNERRVYSKGRITYIPIYYVMCFEAFASDENP